jgi:AcrR family transcriptional regulator
VTGRQRQLGSTWTSGAGAKRNHEPLSRQQIVRGALDFLTTKPLDELSMRRLATHLGTAATSLYWHVSTKEQLLDLVLDEIFGKVQLPSPAIEWNERLRAVAHSLRTCLREHGHAVPLVVARPGVGPNALRVFEYILATLRDAGFEDKVIPFVYDLLANYVIGSVLVESSWLTGVGQNDPQEQTETIASFMRSQPADRYPTLVSLADTLFSQGEDEKFEFGLDRLLAGIAKDLGQ